MVKEKNFWILLFCMLAGLTVGDFIGEICHEVKYLNVLSYSQAFGLDTPVTINLGMLMVTLQFQLKFTLAGIIGMTIGSVLYQKI